jgi:hypothetical protein
MAATSNREAGGSWIGPAIPLGFLATVLVWLLAFGPDVLPEFKQRLIAVFGALLAGIAGYALSGRLTASWGAADSKSPMAVKATSGSAIFLIVLFWWFSPFAPIKVAKDGEPARDGSRIDQVSPLIGGTYQEAILEGEGTISQGGGLFGPSTLIATGGGKARSTVSVPKSEPAWPGVEKLLEEADRLYKAGRYSEAFTLFEKAAAKESPRAWLYLGLMYGTGRGVSVDYGKAMHWYR